MGADQTAENGRLRVAERPSSTVDAMSQTMSGASTLAAGLGTSSAVAEMAKAFGSTSAWTSGMGKSFAGIDVGRGASSALAEMVKTMSGASTLAAGLGTSSAVAEMARSMNGASLGRSFGAYDVGVGTRAARSEPVGTISRAVAASGLPEAVERLTPALDAGFDEEQRRTFRAYMGIMLACVGTHMMLTHPTATSIALTAVMIVQVAWWMATQSSRWLP